MSDRPHTPPSASTIFIVDDDASVRTALERLFRTLGWAVRSFASAEEFLEQDLHHARGCLVADVHLGRMSGLELQARLASQDGAMPVILTSGVDDGNMEREASRLGAIAFFRKPFDVMELLNSIETSLGAHAGDDPGQAPLPVTRKVVPSRS